MRGLAGERGNQQVELLAADVVLAVAENALAGGIQRLDATGLVDRQDRVLDVVEDGLQLGGRAFAHLARERGGLVGEQPHRADDAAAFLVPFDVGAADGVQQLAQIELPAFLAGVVELLLEERMQAHRRKRSWPAAAGVGEC